MKTDKDLVGILIQETNSEGLITLCQSAGNFSTTASKFALGCIMVDTTTGKAYTNTGTTAVPAWTADRILGTATATADGLTTGLILPGETFVTVTSDSATKFITLPAISAATIGQTIDLYVGATGYELVTPASSNNTINTVDADQTNQLDVAANSLVHLIQVSATGWFAYNHAATTITVVAPDND